MKGKIVCFASLLAGLAMACNSSKPAEQQTETHSDTPAIAQVSEAPEFRDSVQYDSLSFPDIYDSSFTGRIIYPGVFHGDEVWDDTEGDKWLGLFKGMGKYYVAATPVTVKRVYDVVLDDDSTKEITGREVFAGNKDSCLLLMSRMGEVLQEHDVNAARLPVNIINPGERTTINFNGTTYVLSATGEKRKQEHEERIWNYKLYLSTTKNGKTITQLLAAYPQFDDSMIELMFAGDIDGDGLLDLIIDNSPHYNSTTPTLYLSKPAAANQLLKIMAIHSSVGC